MLSRLNLYCNGCRTIATSLLSKSKILIKSLNLEKQILMRPIGISFYQSVLSFHISLRSYSDSVISFHLSDIGEGINEVVIKEWFVKVGDEVNQFDSICEVQSDKASVTITSRYDGIIEKMHYNVNETAKIGLPLVDIKIKDHDTKSVNQIDQIVDLDATSQKSSRFSINNILSNKVITTPAVRRIALENNINLSDVTPTGKDGRILKEDVEKYLEDKSKETKTKKTFQSSTANIESFIEPLNKHNIQSLDGIKKAMFKSMTASLKIPHFGYSDEVDLTKLTKLIEEFKERNAKNKITFMPFFMKSLSLALREYPILNSVVDESKEALIYNLSHNIGFAIDTKEGLVVPNVKNVQDLCISEIAEELKRLTELGRANQLKPDDLRGGTITLSNIGSIGGTFGIPVILAPEVAICAIGKKKILPRFDEDGNIVKAMIANILWSADHRVIDGATMCRFCLKWKSYLEDPIGMVMDMR